MATKKLENMDVKELRARHKQVTGRSTKESNKKKLIDAIEQHERMSRRVEIARTAGQKKGTRPRAAAAAAGGGRAEAADAGHDAGAAPAVVATASPDAAPQRRGKWAALSIEELRSLYAEKVGRPTGSDDRGYLIWKIREAEKGHIKTGPVQPRGMSDEPTIPLTLRLPRSLAERADAAWRRGGYRSRTHLIEMSIGRGLEVLGEASLAGEFIKRSALRVGASTGEEV